MEWTDKQQQVVARELYDHQADPKENENVAGDPRHAALLEQLSQRLRATIKPATHRQGEWRSASAQPWRPLEFTLYQEADN